MQSKQPILHLQDAMNAKVMATLGEIVQIKAKVCNVMDALNLGIPNLNVQNRNHREDEVVVKVQVQIYEIL